MSTIAQGLSPGLHKEDEVSSRKKVIIDYIVTHIRVSVAFVWFVSVRYLSVACPCHLVLILVA